MSFRDPFKGEHDNGFGGLYIGSGGGRMPKVTQFVGPPMATPGGGETSMNLMTDESLAGLRRLGTAVKIMTFLALALMIAGVVSIFFFDLTTTTWFSSFYTWLVIIPLMILFVFWPTLYIAYKRNWIGSTYSLFIGLYGVLTILLLALMIWVLVEWFWYCPTFKPDVCTDGSSSAIETGFMIYAIVAILETVMMFAYLFIMWAMRNYYRKIFSGLGSMSRQDAADYLYRTMFEGTTNFITGFGSEMTSFRD